MNLALFVFWEKEGIVRHYVEYYLTGLKKVAQDIIVIVNGSINDEGKQKLAALGVEYIQRENKGLDFAAWQAAIMYLGWEKVSSYDNLILCNSSCYGPIYPFEEGFERMQNTNADFWGMSRHTGAKTLLIPSDPTSIIRPHIQSFFMVFQNNVVCSSAFQNWWNNLIPATNWSEAVAYQEARLTGYLEDNGFKSSCLTDAFAETSMCDGENVMALIPEILTGKMRVPLVKRKLFASDWSRWSSLRLGYHPRRTLEIIRTQSDYPEKFIWEDLLATCKMSTIKDNLHFNYILSSNVQTSIKDKGMRDIALFCYAYYPDLSEHMCDYICNMPSDATIYIVSSREDTLEAYRNCLAGKTFKHIEYIIKPNRGRDISAYLVTGRDILCKHDLICCIHDKKTKQIHPLRAADYGYHCIDTLLHNQTYVENVIDLFEREPHCGMLVQPTVYYSEFTTLGAESTGNIEWMKKLHAELNLSCPLDDTPVASFGTCFWARGKALLPIFRKNWKIEDFPDEPLPPDSTISHGVERIFPIVVQDAEYYTAWCSPDEYANIYMNSLACKIREYNNELYKIVGRRGFPHVLKALSSLARLLPELKRLRARKNRHSIRKYRILDIATCGIMHKYWTKKKKKYKQDNL